MADLFGPQLEAKQAEYLSNNPYLLGGNAIASAAPKIDMSGADFKDQAIFTLLSSALSGGLQGYGQGQAQSNYANEVALPLQQALSQFTPEEQIAGMAGNPNLAAMAPTLQAYYLEAQQKAQADRQKQMLAAQLNPIEGDTGFFAPSLTPEGQIAWETPSGLAGAMEGAGTEPPKVIEGPNGNKLIWDEANATFKPAPGIELAIPEPTVAGQEEEKAQAELAAKVATGETTREEGKLIAAAQKSLWATKTYKDFAHINKTMGSVYKAFDSDSPVSDIELTYSAIHSIEPALAVKEGEIAMVQNAQGIDPQLRGRWLRALQSKSAFSLQLRMDIMKLVQSRHEEARQSVVSTASAMKTPLIEQFYNPRDPGDITLTGVPLEKRELPRVITVTEGPRKGQWIHNPGTNSLRKIK